MTNALIKAHVRTTTKLRSIMTNEKGATAVEYGLLVALIAAVIVVIVATLGQQILAAFTSVSKALPAPAST